MGGGEAFKFLGLALDRHTRRDLIMASNRGYRIGVTVALVAGLASLGLEASSASSSKLGADNPCGLPAGKLSKAEIPRGTSTSRCRLVGRVVEDQHGHRITIPAPGTLVGTASVGEEEDGPDEFVVEVLPDGTIDYPEPEIVDSGDLQAPGVAPSGADLACSEDAYAAYTYKQVGYYEWWVGDGAMPAGLTPSEAQPLFSRVMSRIITSYNNCGLADQVSASGSYQGFTTYEADIAANGTCTSFDGKSTWDAGDLPLGTVAKACWTVSSGDIREADVRYNTTDYDFTTTPNSGCSDKYDAEGVGVHEAGHAYGLSHSGSFGKHLTMYETSFKCSDDARTLGLGDVNALRAKY